MPLKLRSKMLLLALCLLIAPWAGYQHINKTEHFLREEQANVLRSITKTIALLVKDKQQFFHHAPLPNSMDTLPLYAPHIKYPLQIDGYFSDWLEQSFYRVSLDDTQAYYLQPNYQPGAHQVQLALGAQRDALSLFVQVRDADIVYHQADKNPLLSDHIKINWRNKQNQAVSYVLYTAAPGRVNARQIDLQIDSAHLLDIEHKIHAEWQQTQQGYQLEIKIPKSLLNDSLAVNVINLNSDQDDAIVSIIGTSGADSVTALSRLIYPSEQIEALLASITPDKTRIWIVDINRRIIGQYGQLKTAHRQIEEDNLAASSIIHDIYRRIISTTESTTDPFQGAVVIDMPEVDTALRNTPVLAWKQFGDTHRLIAIQPVVDAQGEVMGAVVAERSNYDILILQNVGIEELINSTLLIFTAAIVLIFMFASRLTFRIKKLRNATEQAISTDGRIHLTTFPHGADELGELAQTFHQMLSRLNQYNRYLETMASNLAHEIRTPVAIVKSSLEHLQLGAHNQDAPTYIQRAYEGVQRLSHILNSMSEATQLEQSLQQTQKEQFALHALVQGCHQGYQAAFPKRRFQLRVGTADNFFGSPDGIAQALDKLVDNAVEFSPEHSVIHIILSKTAVGYRLQVDNDGPALPENMRRELFHSMVSVRREKTDKPHLGLGLYIVRLIAEHHDGSVTAENLSQKGVSFSLFLPHQQD